MSRTDRENRTCQRRDPVLTALRRLLTETDRSIAAADKVRQARVELARLLQHAASTTEGQA